MGNLEKGIELVTKATIEDRNRNYNEAYRLYEQGVEYLLDVIKYEAVSDKVKHTTHKKCAQYLKRAENLSNYLRGQANWREPIIDSDSWPKTKIENGEANNSDSNKYWRNENISSQLEGASTIETQNIKSDVAGLEGAKEPLEEVVEKIPCERTLIFSDSEEMEKSQEHDSLKLKLIIENLEKENELLQNQLENKNSSCESCESYLEIVHNQEIYATKLSNSLKESENCVFQCKRDIYLLKETVDHLYSVNEQLRLCHEEAKKEIEILQDEKRKMEANLSIQNIECSSLEQFNAQLGYSQSSSNNRN